MNIILVDHLIGLTVEPIMIKETNVASYDPSRVIFGDSWAFFPMKNMNRGTNTSTTMIRHQTV